MQEQQNVKSENQAEPEKRGRENLHILSNGGKDDKSSGSLEGRQKYKDVADAAQAAFESAAYAAAAARAAVELSRSESHDPPSDHHNSPRKGVDGHDDAVEDKEIPRETQGEEVDKSDNEEAVKEATVSMAAEVDAHHLKEEQDFDESENEADYEHKSNQSFKKISWKNDDGKESGSGPRDPIIKAVSGSMMQSTPLLDLEKKPFSMRTRGVRGY